MVRGWNDTGSRISVRFSDTSEQRELRVCHFCLLPCIDFLRVFPPQRTERAAREGEQSPARLTIAQAALLNLRGQELRVQAAAASMQSQLPLPALTFDRRTIRPLPEHARFSEYSTNAYVPSPAFTVDYSLAPGRPYIRSQTPGHNSPYHHHASLPSDVRTPAMDPTMAALLDSLRGGGVPFQSANSYSGGQSGAYQDLPHHHTLNHGGLNALDDIAYGISYEGDAGAVHPRSGYTATEEFIMRAHADSNVSQRRRPPPLDLVRRRRADSDANANIGVGVRGYRTQASAVSLPHQQQQQYQTFSPSPVMEPLPQMDEENFHTNIAHNDYRQPQSQIQTGDGPRSTMTKHNHRIHPAHVNARLSRDHAPAQQQTQQQAQNQPSLVQAPSPNPNLHHYQQAHLRSSTLPHRTTPTANQHQRHYQHSSMSIPNSNSGTRSNQLNNNNNSNAMNKNINISISDAVGIYDGGDRTDGISSNNGIHYDSKTHHRHHHHPDVAAPPRNYRAQNQNFYEVDQTSPSLVSPSLTYSSHTPSTLSPATPFFGSFGGQAEGFADRAPPSASATPAQGFEGKKMRAGSR